MIWPLSNRLRQDLRERGLTAEKAATVAGLSSYAVYAWIKGTATPGAGKLRQLLDRCGIDPGPYQTFISVKPLFVTLVCPTCGLERQARRANLKPITRKKRGREALRVLVEDRYELPCLHCSRLELNLPEIGRKELQKINAERFRNGLAYLGVSPDTPPKELGAHATGNVRRVALAMAFGSRTGAATNIAVHRVVAAAREQMVAAARQAALDPEDPAREQMVEQARKAMAEAEQKMVEAEQRAMVESGKRVITRNHEKFRAMVKAPRSDRHRRAIARSRVLRGDVSGLDLCLLCGLVVQRRRWQVARYGRSWHHDCLITWCRYCRTVLGRTPRRGVLPLPNGSGRGRKPTDNLKRNYRRLIRRRTGKNSRRQLAEKSDPTSVTKSIASFILRLPGSWPLVAATSRNRVLQEVAPLPDILQPLVEAGERDPLIERLHRYGMADETVARLTGAAIGRVRRLCASAPSAVASDEAVPDILRVGGLVVDRQRRMVTRGDQSVRLSARQCELLARLAARPGQIVGPAELAASGSRSDGSAINLVRLRVCRLRRKLGPGVVEVVRGGGYKLASGP